MRRLFSLIGVFLACVSCQAKPVLVRPVLETEGALYVYLRTLPQEARRLSFRLADLSATRAGGEPIPLSLSLAEIDSGTASRDRLLAFGDLPPGQYNGLSLRVGKADLAGEEGKATLRLADDRAGISVPFLVRKRKAVVLTLQLHYRESLREGYRFTPVFSASVPGSLPTGLTGLVSCRGTNSVMIFNKVSGQVVAVIPTGSSPMGMAIDPARRRAYVALSGEDAVEVIDLLDDAVIGRIALTGGDRPVELALTPDGRTLLSANSGSGTVSVIDPSSLLERNRVPMGSSPRSILIHRSGRKAFVLDDVSNTVSVMEISTGSVIRTVPTESGPARGQLSRDGNLLYLLQRGSSYLTVLDAGTLSVNRRIYVGPGGSALKVDPQSDWIYFANRNSEGIDVYEPFSLLPVDEIPAGGLVSYMTIDGEGNNLFLTLPERNRVRAVRLVGKENASEIDVGEEPSWIIFMGER